MKKIGYWLARIIAAVIMAQTLYFKFSGSSESVYIFSTIGMEPWGRIGTGILEIFAVGLLLVNATAWMGAALGLGLMSGAIGMHLTILGISVPNENGSHDGGYLFMLAVMVWVCCALVLALTGKKWKGRLRQIFPRLS
ncbi:MAG TPA: DoxX family protein [Ohtaekwangia sp.]|nr:DoxX family protein [Ohtaekwangia sp.]